MLITLSIIKMVVQQTSLMAYEEVNINRNERIMYNVIKQNTGICNKEISNYLNRPINEITGRVKGLRDKGLVKEIYKKYYDARLVMCWGVV